MVTGDFKNSVDRIWETFWAGGITNPLTVIEQFTYLLFIKGLDEKQNVTHIIENGMIEKNILNYHPFNKYGSIVSLFENRLDTVKGIVKQIYILNDRISV